MMKVVTVSPKGQVVIPAPLRLKLGLLPGEQALVYLMPGKKVIVEKAPKDPVAAAYGSLAGYASLAKSLLAERKKELKNEEKEIAKSRS